MGKLLCLAIKLIKPATVGANPEHPRPVFVNRADSIVTQAVRIAGDGPIMAKWFSPAIKNIHAATIGRYPGHPRLILID